MNKRTLSVLVVEDHPFQAAAVCSLLQQLGATTTQIASDAQAAMDLLVREETATDIIISDLAMPEGDGLSLIRHLSEAGHPASLVLLSAHDEQVLTSAANLARRYRLQLLGVLKKPPTLDKLRPLLQEHEHRTRTADAPIPPVGLQDERNFTLAEIASAMAGDEFEPWLEPVIDLKTAQVVGLDVYPVWASPLYGPLRWEEFEPSIKARGLQDEFVHQLLTQCLELDDDLRRRGSNLNLALNIECPWLAKVKFADRLIEQINASGVKPGNLTLCVRERNLDVHSSIVLENLARLRMHGLQIRLQDFGGGSMAVETLANYPFTELGIVEDFVNAPSERAGLAISIEVARRAGIGCVAAGLRNVGDWDELFRWGCDRGRGPLISAPLAPGAVRSWIKKWSAAHS